MSRFFLIAALSITGMLMPAEAFGLGSDHPAGDVGGNSAWPEGLKELVNRKDRVHGFWVNDTDVFFYNGEGAALNQFLADYGKLKGPKLRVVLHPGTKKARSPWDKADRNLPVSWSMQTSSHAPDDLRGPHVPGMFYTRIDVYLGSPIKLEELRVPGDIEVTSGGEIEKFIADRVEQKRGL